MPQPGARVRAWRTYSPKQTTSFTPAPAPSPFFLALAQPRASVRAGTTYVLALQQYSHHLNQILLDWLDEP